MPRTLICLLALLPLFLLPPSAWGGRLQHPLLTAMAPPDAALARQALTVQPAELPALLAAEGHGELTISAPDRFVYAITDGAAMPYRYRDENGEERRQQAFATITATINHQLPNLGAIDGELFAVARYRLINNHRADLSTYPPTVTDIADNYSYSFAEGGLVTGLSHTKTKEFLFDFAAEPIPVGISDLTLMVVFLVPAEHGRESVLAVGMQDLSEPDHHVFWNSSDQVVIDQKLYAAEQIISDPELFNYVDFNNNGILNEEGEPYIAPYPVSFKVNFTARDPKKTGAPWYRAAAINNLPPARHSRLIILTDQPDPQTSWVTVISYDNPRDPTAHAVNHYAFQSAAVRATPSLSATPLTPADYAYRGIRQHHFLAEFHCSIIDRAVMLDPDPCPEFGQERPLPQNPDPHPVELYTP
ncbi:hypothetical protein [Desulfurivibrio dismutans]|uniref:hypothetical protein n=1 Tax=Desulfurivibrio dismutans TaxID=1398908 RepID=UPI0023DCE01B|nr:hypothetical protein [Desulfurivibrio alkaliphilus]MDF1614676.1 hypothetical protein [Desulfurivibrio alkaliphilus]